MTRIPSTLLLLAIASGAALAQEGSAACQSPAHRAFDFWTGTWHVDVGGPAPAVSRIVPDLGGCVVLEYFDAPNGMRGRSLNAYDPDRGVWTQTYSDDDGMSLRLRGRLVGRTMVLSDSVRPTANPDVRLRSTIRWEPTDTGTVRQVWDLSTDGGQTTRPAFDGMYVRAPDSDVAVAPARDAARCRTGVPAFRDLDWLVGQWRVQDTTGHAVGTSSVTVELGGCLLEERYRGSGGIERITYLQYDRFLKRWFAVSADNRGQFQELQGQIGDGGLVLAGPDGLAAAVRVTWSRVEGAPAGRVQRRTERSTADARATGEVLVYEPAPALQPGP